MNSGSITIAKTPRVPLVAENSRYTTIRICCTLADGRASVGTGFFYQVSVGADKFAPVIITNKHVIEGAVSTFLRFHVADGDGRVTAGQFDTEIKVRPGEAFSFPHPDPSVDLCAIPVASLGERAAAQHVQLYLNAFDKKTLGGDDFADELDAVEPVLMIGYPNGLWDELNNFPLMRMGTTATHPRAAYNGQQIFMIDMPCFPGSSGSPVCLFQRGITKIEGGSISVTSRFRLLGALYAGPSVTAEGRIIQAPVPTAATATVQTKLMMNLGYVINSARIEELAKVVEGVALAQG